MDMYAHINGSLKRWIIAQTNLPQVSRTRWTCKEFQFSQTPYISSSCLHDTLLPLITLSI